MRYALNVADAVTMTRSEPGIVAILIVPRLTHETVDAEPGRFDGMAALFADEPGIEAFCQVLRARHGKSKLRMYESATGCGGWRRI